MLLQGTRFLPGPFYFLLLYLITFYYFDNFPPQIASKLVSSGGRPRLDTWGAIV